MNLLRVFHYYTSWTLLLHLLFKETYWLAVFVKYVGNSIFLGKLLIGKSNILSVLMILLSHELPYMFKKMRVDESSKILLIVTLLCYVMMYGISFIYDLYMNKDVMQYLFHTRGIEVVCGKTRIGDSQVIWYDGIP